MTSALAIDAAARSASRPSNRGVSGRTGACEDEGKQAGEAKGEGNVVPTKWIPPLILASNAVACFVLAGYTDFAAVFGTVGAIFLVAAGIGVYRAGNAPQKNDNVPTESGK
jgi:hypothetical protein